MASPFSRTKMFSLLAAGAVAGVGVDEAARWATTPNPLRVKKVHDGDTFTLQSGQEIRIWGIDAPELKQHLGPDAQRQLKALLSHSFLGVPLGMKTVEIKIKSTSFNRKVAEVFVSGRNVAALMVESGNAYSEPKYAKDAFAKSEEKAREKRLGVWAGDKSGETRPWDFRHPNGSKKS